MVQIDWTWTVAILEKGMLTESISYTIQCKDIASYQQLGYNLRNLSWLPELKQQSSLIGREQRGKERGNSGHNMWIRRRSLWLVQIISCLARRSRLLLEPQKTTCVVAFVCGMRPSVEFVSLISDLNSEIKIGVKLGQDHTFPISFAPFPKHWSILNQTWCVCRCKMRVSVSGD